MRRQELIEHIKNYLENDCSQTAMMLTAGWGHGKSYFIKNDLLPALNAGDSNRGIIVSLYGCSSIKDLSKALYLEVRASCLSKKSEKLSAGKIIAKTIVKGVASFFNIDLSVSQEDLDDLYQSIDLTSKLVIIEDLDRSNLDIFEVFGYVNNLVEQDGAKVLLVANEEAIINRIDAYNNATNSSVNDGSEIKTTNKNELTKKYREQKEKTIGDTVLFESDKFTALSNILNSFDNVYLKRCLNEYPVEDKKGIIYSIIEIMDTVKCENLRAIMYACQKVKELVDKCKLELDLNFFKRVFLSITAFSLRLKMDSTLEWKYGVESPAELGTAKFPLYRFCYDYVKFQSVLASQIADYQNAFIVEEDKKQKQKRFADVFNEIYNFATNKQTKLEEAIKEIYKLLADGNSVPLEVYGRLANYLIAVKPIVDIPEIIDKCKEQMLANISMSEVDDALISNLTYHDGVQLWDADQIEEYNIYKQNLLRAATDRKNVRLISAVTPDDWESIIKDIDNNLDRYIGSGSVFGRLNIPSLLGYLKQTDANALNNFRGCVMAIYRPINIKEFLRSDRENLIILRDGVNEIIDNKSAEDKVCLLQFEWLRKELGQIIDKLQ